MIVIPAIDLLGGKCVRLVNGSLSNEIKYSFDPLELAQQYAELGAKQLHVIDLDGAFSGQMKNINLIKNLAKKYSIQVGGGVRSQEQIDELLAAGVEKIIVSSILLKDQNIAQKIKSKYKNNLIGSFDFKDGLLSYAGWKKQSELSFEEASIGLSEIIITDTSRDGTLTGPNIEFLKSLRTKTNAKLIAAGGVTTVQDIANLKAIGMNGAVVGRSAIENKEELRRMLCFAKE